MFASEHLSLVMCFIFIVAGGRCVSILCMILIYETSLMLLPAAGSLKPDDVAICISVIKLIDFKKNYLFIFFKWKHFASD